MLFLAKHFKVSNLDSYSYKKSLFESQIWVCNIDSCFDSGAVVRRCSVKRVLLKIHRKTPVPETLAKVFFCEFCEIFKNTFFIEHLRWLLLLIHHFGKLLNHLRCLFLEKCNCHVTEHVRVSSLEAVIGSAL